MNEQKILAITSTLDSLKNFDLNDRITKKYSNFSENDLKKHKINNLTIIEFKTLFDKIINQFLRELKSENGFILPEVFYLNGSNYDIQSAVNSLKGYIENSDFHNAENYLIFITQYAMMFGFYDKSKYKLHTENSKTIQNELSKISLMNDNYLQISNKYEKLFSEIKELKSSLDILYSEKQDDFSEMSDNLDKSNEYLEKIQSIVDDAENLKSETQNVLEKSQELQNTIDEISYNMSELENQSRISTEKLDEQEQNWQNKIEKIYQEFDNKLKFVESKTSFFEERNKYLEELIGREVGASLFETFKQRKIELNKSVQFWTWCVPIVSILSLIYTLTIFTNGFGIWGEIQTQFSWQIFTLNVLKSIPVIFILYYCISQYNKERNFQEEYAFKSASALTIKAYADILNEVSKKDELVFEAVNNLYKSPHHLISSQKDVNSTLDLAKEIIGKLGEVVNSKKDKTE